MAPAGARACEEGQRGRAEVRRGKEAEELCACACVRACVCVCVSAAYAVAAVKEQHEREAQRCQQVPWSVARGQRQFCRGK